MRQPSPSLAALLGAAAGLASITVLATLPAESATLPAPYAVETQR